MRNPFGITPTPDGSAIVAEYDTKILYLVTHDGSWVKKLWGHPGDGVSYDNNRLKCVSVLDNVCICSNLHGSLFVLDVSF